MAEATMQDECRHLAAETYPRGIWRVDESVVRVGGIRQ